MIKVNKCVQDSGTTLTLAIAPASDHPGGLDLGTLVDYLSKETGVSILSKRCSDYAEAIEMLCNGSAQIGWLGPYALREAAGRDGTVEAFAVGIPKGKNSPNYHSLFIVKSTSKMHMLADVRNSIIGVGDEFSTSGREVPRRELAEIGIDLGNESAFAEVVTMDNHDTAIRAVMDGEVDVAAVSSINLEAMVVDGSVSPSEFRIIHQSTNIPGAPLVYTSKLPSHLKQRLKELVLDAHNHFQVGGYGGLIDRYVDPVESHRNHLKKRLRPQWGWRTIVGIFAFISVYALVFIDLEVDLAQLISQSIMYISDVLGRMLPPDFSNFRELMSAMVETVEIAMLGTLLAIILSIPIGLLSARNIAPNYFLYFVARTVTVFFRAIPEFIMAMILVIAIGFGAMPGVIALGFHTMGFLAKFYAEAIEHIDENPIQALDSMGASKGQVLAFAVAPQVMPAFIGHNLYILDRNIRMATMLGIVGAGGIGYELQSAFRMFEYDRVSAIIIVIFATIFLIDMISSHVRAKIMQV